MRLRLAGIAFARSGRPAVSTRIERAYMCGRASAASAGAPPAAIEAAQSLMNPRRSMTGILSKRGRESALQVVALFVMENGVQPFVFLFRADPHSRDCVGELEKAPGDQRRPCADDQDADELHQHLAAHGLAFRVAHAAEVGGSEHPG